MCYVNVVDFDYTIYRGDSTVDFYLFCLKRHPYYIKYVPKQVQVGIKYFLKREELINFKRQFFCFLKDIDNIEQEVAAFWVSHRKKIKKWYGMRDKRLDIIISASPSFLLASICKEMQVKHLIATDIDSKTGERLSSNCKGEEKVRRFRAQYGETKIKQFYSDSLSDLPLARLAEESYLVKKERIIVWETERLNQINNP